MSKVEILNARLEKAGDAMLPSLKEILAKEAPNIRFSILVLPVFRHVSPKDACVVLSIWHDPNKDVDKEIFAEEGRMRLSRLSKDELNTLGHIAESLRLTLPRGSTCRFVRSNQDICVYEFKLPQ